MCVQTPSRDLMLNDFFTKKTQMVTVMKNMEDLEKLKRSDLLVWAVDMSDGKMCSSHDTFVMYDGRILCLFFNWFFLVIIG